MYYFYMLYRFIVIIITYSNLVLIEKIKCQKVNQNFKNILLRKPNKKMLFFCQCTPPHGCKKSHNSPYKKCTLLGEN